MYKKICPTLRYSGNLLISTATITWRVSVSAFDSLIGIPVGIASSAVGIKICAITAGIKKCKSITKKTGEKMIKQYY